jgi:hypothetical protein
MEVYTLSAADAGRVPQPVAADATTTAAARSNASLFKTVPP